MSDNGKRGTALKWLLGVIAMMTPGAALVVLLVPCH